MMNVFFAFDWPLRSRNLLCLRLATLFTNCKKTLKIDSFEVLQSANTNARECFPNLFCQYIALSAEGYFEGA